MYVFVRKIQIIVEAYFFIVLFFIFVVLALVFFYEPLLEIIKFVFTLRDDGFLDRLFLFLNQVLVTNFHKFAFFDFKMVDFKPTIKVFPYSYPHSYYPCFFRSSIEHFFYLFDSLHMSTVNYYTPFSSSPADLSCTNFSCTDFNSSGTNGTNTNPTPVSCSAPEELKQEPPKEEFENTWKGFF